MPCPHSMKRRTSSLTSALSHPLPQTPCQVGPFPIYDNLQHEVKLRPPLCRPPKHSMRSGEKRAFVLQGLFLTFRGPFASHEANTFPNRTRIARYRRTPTVTVYHPTQGFRCESGIFEGGECTNCLNLRE